jgi:penicillin-binding protein 1A
VHQRLFVALVTTLSVCLWGAAGAAAWFLHDVVTGLPDAASLHRVGSMAQSTLVLDAQDKPVFTIFSEQRIEVPLSRVSPHLISALLAIEDQRFYEHGAVDLVRVAGAAVSNLREGRRAQGGSTLTQQLARQSFLTPDKTLRRKVKEIVVAARLEREFSKNDILQLYLNKVYFGDGLYGVEAASLGYFGAHAADLDVAQAALLAGLVKSPSAYAPTVSLERATARRNLVLDQMRASGAIDDASCRRAQQERVVLKDALGRDEPFGLYFKEEVRKQLVDRFGWERVHEGGLRVFTTIDPVMQQAAEAEVTRALAAIERRQKGRRAGAPDEPLQAALVALDPSSGEVRALVGGRDFNQSPFNRATQARRQPGSAFKPFVYAAAIEAGYSPASLLTDLDLPVTTDQGVWVPEDEHSDAPSMTMRSALRTSSNRAAVRMLEEIGIPSAVDYASRFGVGSVPSVPSLALGSGEVTLISMTAAYSAFAHEGVLSSPTLIRRVEAADGTLLVEAHPSSVRAVRDTTAFLINTMLADVVDQGTAAAARREGFVLPAAGKTGTTNDFHDAWFVGYTPRLVTGVWVGYDQPRTIVSNGYASELAVPMWSRFMRTATRRDGPAWFQPPSSITTANICRLSGLLAGEGCRDVAVAGPDGKVVRGSLEYTEYFVRGTEPVDYCPLHGRVHGTLPVLASSHPDVDHLLDAPAIPPSTPGTIGVQAPAAAPAAAAPPADKPASPQPEKKKGFWARVFGR